MFQPHQRTTPGRRGRSIRVATRMGEAALAATSIETVRHSDDVELIVGAMCEKLDLTEAERQSVLAAARLHDIGKMALPPGILDKPSGLDPEEWRVVRRHTIIGEQILASVNELREVAILVRHSHERWDGHGYPDGLEGEQIPLGSRIIFCADSFHAIRSDRPYRNGTSAERALAEVRRNAGTQFDPRAVKALTEVVHELRIAQAGSSHFSSRLTALLTTLAVGLGGSAIASSDLLDDSSVGGPARTAPLTPVPCQPADCALGPVLFEPTTAFARASSPAATAREGGAAAPGFKPGQDGTPPGSGKRGDETPAGSDRVSPGNTPGPEQGGGSSGGGGGNGNEASGGGTSGSSPGKSGSARGGGSGKSGASGTSGGSGKSDASSKSGKTGGSGGSSGPGNSGNATGQQTSPGNSGNAPGHNK